MNQLSTHGLGIINQVGNTPEAYFGEQAREPEEVQSITGEQLATISNRISDIKGVTESLFGRLSLILVQTSREPTVVKEKRAAVPTKLGQSLDEIINQLGGALDYLRDLHESIRL